MGIASCMNEGGDRAAQGFGAVEERAADVALAEHALGAVGVDGVPALAPEKDLVVFTAAEADAAHPLRPPRLLHGLEFPLLACQRVSLSSRRASRR
eukprot:scaffold259468_cov31-Tisochrysis_lutea.AAC.1